MYSLDVSQTVHCYRFGRMRQINGWKHKGPRQNKKNLLVFLVDGAADFQVAGVDHTLQAGDVLIVPAGTMYKAHTDDFCDYYFFHFDGEIRQADYPTLPPISRRFSFVLPALTDPCIYFFDHIRTDRDFNRIYNSVIACTNYHAYGSYIGQRMLECEFLKIMLTLTEIGERQQQPAEWPKALERMVVFIKKNLTRPLGLEEICTDCGISASYAGRLFKKHMNTSVTEYINSEKLYYARELIDSTGMNLTEIAEYLGYCDVYYFSKRFKRQFGQAPSALKKQR